MAAPAGTLTKLYAVPGSHPSACVEAALLLKGVAYQRVDLVPLLHKPRQRLLFGRPTVPAIKLGSERVVGSREILRHLDRLVPEPALYPRDRAALTGVEEAERWGEETLQPATRRLTYAHLRRHPGALRSYLDGARLALPTWLLMLSRAPSLALGSRLNGASEHKLRHDLAQLPGWIDQIDRWIDTGVLGGPQPNAADLQVGSSLRLLLTLGDVRSLLAGRPAAALAEHWFPRFPGSVPAGTLPSQWLACADAMTRSAPRKIVVVVTSHDCYDKSDERTGLWLGELTHFWEVVCEAGFEIDVVSPMGGRVPIDERSLGLTGGARRANRAFLDDARLRAKLEQSLRPDEVLAEDYDAIYFAGGHGAMWDVRGNAELARLAEAVLTRGGVVSAVCHGVAGVLDLRRTDGTRLIDGQPVTGYANVEERAVRKTSNVPFLLEDELLRAGGRYRRGRLPFASHVEVGERLVTGQNPFSTKAVARALVGLLAGGVARSGAPPAS